MLLDRLDPKIKHTEEDARERNITEKDLIQAEMNRKKDNTEDVSREEIIARACEDLLKMSEQGRKIFSSLSEGEQKTLFEKVKAIITDLLNWVNDLLNSYESTSTEARIMREYKEQLQKASKVWDKMLEDSVKVNQVLEKSGAFEHSNTTDANVLYDEKESLHDACDLLETISDEDYKKLKDKHPLVYVMDFTPQIIIDSLRTDTEFASFIKDRAILIRRDALYLAIRENGIQEGNYHGLGAETLKNIPTYLENPDVIITTNTSNKRCLVLSHISAKNGQGIISVEFESPKRV